MNQKISEQKIGKYAREVIAGELNIRQAKELASSSFAVRARKILKKSELKTFDKKWGIKNLI